MTPSRVRTFLLPWLQQAPATGDPQQRRPLQSQPGAHSSTPIPTDGTAPTGTTPTATVPQRHDNSPHPEGSCSSLLTGADGLRPGGQRAPGSLRLPPDYLDPPGTADPLFPTQTMPRYRTPCLRSGCDNTVKLKGGPGRFARPRLLRGMWCSPPQRRRWMADTRETAQTQFYSQPVSREPLSPVGSAPGIPGYGDPPVEAGPTNKRRAPQVAPRGGQGTPRPLGLARSGPPGCPGWGPEAKRPDMRFGAGRQPGRAHNSHNQATTKR